MIPLATVLTRARSACEQHTVYWAGAGGRDPQMPLPTCVLAVGRLWPALSPDQQSEFEPLAVAAGLNVHDPALTVNACDCSGFVCWALGFGRHTQPAPFTDAGGWIFTDSIWADAMEGGVRFQRRTLATPGCLVVYPKQGSGESFGHVGIVLDADAAGRATSVVHCAASNFKTAPCDAIKITSAERFEAQKLSVYAWCREVG